jgi:hypothetical protein
MAAAGNGLGCTGSLEGRAACSCRTSTPLIEVKRRTISCWAARSLSS